MTDRGIAKRYARALFRVAKEKQLEEILGQSLQRLQSFLREESASRQFLFKYPVERDLKQKVVANICSSLQVEKELENLLQLLVMKGRFNLTELIAEEYDRLYRLDRHQQVLEVYTPMELEPFQKDRLQEVFARFTGKQIQVEVKVDPAVKGGFMARLGDTMFDASLSSQLDEIYHQITA